MVLVCVLLGIMIYIAMTVCAYVFTRNWYKKTGIEPSIIDIVVVIAPFYNIIPILMYGESETVKKFFRL